MATANIKYKWGKLGINNEQMFTTITLELSENETIELYYLVTHAKDDINVPEIATIRGVLSRIINLK